jgi:hypothetical protein
MTQNKSTKLVIAFVISCVAVGAPYWLIPYNKVNLPNALMGPGLLVIILAALMLRLYGKISFWRIVKIIGAILYQPLCSLASLWMALKIPAPIICGHWRSSSPW